MSPRFSRSDALPAYPDLDQAGWVPGHPVRMSILPRGLTALLGGLMLAATYLVPDPEQQEPESLTYATLRGHRDQVNAVASAPDGRTMASAGEDHTAVLWAVTTNTREAMILKHGLPVYSVASHPTARPWPPEGSMRSWALGRCDGSATDHAEGAHLGKSAPGLRPQWCSIGFGRLG